MAFIFAYCFFFLSFSEVNKLFETWARKRSYEILVKRESNLWKFCKVVNLSKTRSSLLIFFLFFANFVHECKYLCVPVYIYLCAMSLEMDVFYIFPSITYKTEPRSFFRRWKPRKLLVVFPYRQKVVKETHQQQQHQH